jgi:hypothetical protein
MQPQSEPRIGDLHLVLAEQHRKGAEHRRDRAAGADHRDRRMGIDQIMGAGRGIGAEQIEDGDADRPQRPFHLTAAIEQGDEVEDEVDEAAVDEGRGERGQPERGEQLVLAVGEPRRDEAAPDRRPFEPAGGDQDQLRGGGRGGDGDGQAGLGPAVRRAHRPRSYAQTNSILRIS